MQNTLISIFVLFFCALPLLGQGNLELLWEKNTHYEDGLSVDFAKFSADGKYIYCATGGGNVQKMDAETGEFIVNVDSGDVTQIYDLAMAERGKYFVTYNGSDGVDIWDTESDARIKHISITPSEGIEAFGTTAVAISPDDNYLLIGFRESIPFPNHNDFIILYDIEENKEIKRILIGKNNLLSEIAISHDGKYFATGASYIKNEWEKTWYNRLILWDAETIEPIDTLQDVAVESSSQDYRKIVFSVDDKYLGVVRDTYPWSVQLFDLETKTLAMSSDNRQCRNIVFLPDSTYYVVSYVPSEIYKLGTNEFIDKTDKFGALVEISLNTKMMFVRDGDRVYFYKVLPTAVEDRPINESNINIYTQNNIIYIESTEQIIDATIYITDLLGKEIYQESIPNIPANTKQMLDLQLPTGTYLCKIVTSGKEYSQKIQLVR